MEDLLIFIVQRTVQCILFYPLGLVRIWITGKRQKSFIIIFRENNFSSVVKQGGIVLQNTIAAVGSVVLLCLLVVMIGILGWVLFNLMGEFFFTAETRRR